MDLSRLTLTEHQVIQLKVQGLSFDQIASELEMAPRTAQNHAAKAAKKLGHTPTSLVRLLSSSP